MGNLGTLVRSAFNAATSDSDTLRIEGFSTLLDIITDFGQAPDPDFEVILFLKTSSLFYLSLVHTYFRPPQGAFLLEQYQAQIGAALRPAFADDADPRVSAIAGRVCGSWMSSGVSKDEGELKRYMGKNCENV